MTDGVSLADIAAVTDNNKDGMFGGADKVAKIKVMLSM